MSQKARVYSLGLDFGTNSVRALIVDVTTGEEISTAVANYPSGEAGILLDPKDPELARQNPADYVEAMAKVIKKRCGWPEKLIKTSGLIRLLVSVWILPVRHLSPWIKTVYP